jgi:hypothetical protein
LKAKLKVEDRAILFWCVVSMRSRSMSITEAGHKFWPGESGDNLAAAASFAIANGLRGSVTALFWVCMKNNTSFRAFDKSQ